MDLACACFENVTDLWLKSWNGFIFHVSLMHDTFSKIFLFLKSYDNWIETASLMKRSNMCNDFFATKISS